MNGPRKRTVSIVDIAKALQLSKTTVQQVLTDTGNISPETRARVKAMAEELGYRPNLLARVLRTRRSGFIAVLLNERISTPFHQAFMDVAESLIPNAGYTLVAVCSHHNAAEEMRLLDQLLGFGIEACLLEPDPSNMNVARYEQICRQIPLVLLGNSALPQIATVAVDQFAIGYRAAQHLLDRGCERLLFLTSSEPTLTWDWWANERLRGCEQAVHERHGVTTPVLRVPFSFEHSELHGAALAAVQAFAAQGGACDGIVGANDAMAMAAISALHTLGMRIPDEVAVIGVDNHPAGSMLSPTLTSVVPPAEQLAEAACAHLIACLAPDGEPPVATHQTFAPKVIVERESTRRVVNCPI